MMNFLKWCGALLLCDPLSRNPLPRVLLSGALLLACVMSPVSASANTAGVQSAQSLDELLSVIRQQQAQQRRQDQEREAAFRKARQQQATLLEQARQEHSASQQKLKPLQETLEQNRENLDRLSKQLQEETQTLGDLRAAFRAFSGDVAASLQASMVTPSVADRQTELTRLATLDTVPEVKDLESLWLLMQEEMTRAGEMQRYQGQVVDSTGVTRQQTVLRVGTFTSFSESGFLRYVPETGELLVPGRQPAGRFPDQAQAFFANPRQQPLMIIDPTQGSLLGMLSLEPGWRERIEQAGVIGLIIIGLGGLGLLITLWRVFYLLWVALRVRGQMKQPASPVSNNPLGRVLLQAQSFRTSREENLEFKLDEAVLVELPRLERGHNFIKLLSAVAPLLGLLGTVTGMILTFQSISLFGNGDPKLMAGGISQALMTTVLGLIVAIPLLFGHSFVNALARQLIQRLDEQSAGLLASSIEQRESSS